jgi:hypothetical protein
MIFISFDPVVLYLYLLVNYGIFRGEDCSFLLGSIFCLLDLLLCVGFYLCLRLVAVNHWV